MVCDPQARAVVWRELGLDGRSLGAHRASARHAVSTSSTARPTSRAAAVESVRRDVYALCVTARAASSSRSTRATPQAP
eukprot:5715653-Prymnesium_polylepis.1